MTGILLRILFTLFLFSTLSSCSDNDDGGTQPDNQALPLFAPEGKLKAEIRWTTHGVPHIKAENIESMAYGVGYASANDNICIIADQVTKFNSQRSKYFGPDRVINSGDSANLISDFGYLTIGLRELAEQHISSMSDMSKALLSGYAKGFNFYLNEKGKDNLAPACASQPWVKDIDETDMLTYLLGIGTIASSNNFLNAMFIAAPPSEDFRPRVKSTQHPYTQFQAKRVSLPNLNPMSLGSNGWGLGREKTENQRGMVLGNPHFPHRGALRFWQFHTTIPNYLNAMGASILGMPGPINIGFNENVAWTHTFSTAEHFIIYELFLDEADTSSLSYRFDNTSQDITSRVYEIEVADGTGGTTMLQKTSFYSDLGPIVVVPDVFEWKQGQRAYAFKDANLPNLDILDHWMSMNLADNMQAFKQAFQNHDGVIFNNTMSASEDGQVFYIDDSTVPALSDEAMTLLKGNTAYRQIRQQFGVTVLPANESKYVFTSPVSYDSAPKYESFSYVQNSNDSYWLTNAENPLPEHSPLYGKFEYQQSLRSRMAHRMMKDSSGVDQRFSLQDLEDMIFNNRSYLAEEALNPLLVSCTQQGPTPILVDDEDVSIQDACNALANWDGRFNTDSIGAAIFKEFAFQFNTSPQWVVPFSASTPLDTPRDLLNNSTTLAHFARAVKNLNDANVPMDAALGDVQFVEASLPDGSPSGNKLPWAGGHNIDGSFNVFDGRVRENDTMIPRHSYPTLPNTDLSIEAGGYHLTYGSSWVMLMNFTNDGPIAKGLLTYSQSTHPTSEYYNDQTRIYSQGPQLRTLFFSENDIQANVIKSKVISYSP